MSRKSKTMKTADSWTDYPIPKPILKALRECNYKEPLPIQTRTLRATLIQDKHVFGAARTGSGKTMAYAIPTVASILNNDNSCSKLKRKICRHLQKKEDFELIDGNMVSVEDMIVDKLPNDGSDEEDDTNQESSSEDSTEDSDITFSCPEAIVLVPTRELATQVKEEIDRICKYTDIKTCCLIGGLSQDKQLRNLRHKPQIIIATPGRLYDIVESGNVEHLNLQSIASLRTLVIDEADRMVQKGHFEELLKIVDIVKESKQLRQDFFPYKVYLFSATLTFLHELPDRFKLNGLSVKESRSNNSKKSKAKTPVDTSSHTKKNKIRQMLKLLGIERSDTRILDLNDDASFGRPTSEQLSEMRINCLANEKDLYLYYIITQNKNKRTLVFCNSKDCLRRLTNVLKYLGFETLKLFSDMDQKKRLSSLERFRKNQGSVLVATDIAARGLDIKELDCVVHYQVPKTCESYIHRSGRTARLDKKGLSVTLCEPKETPYYRRLCNNINGGKDLVDYEIDTNLKTLLKDRILIAQQCDKIDHRLRGSKSDRNWFSKAAKECEIELDDEDIRVLSGHGKSKQQNVEEEAGLKRQLSSLHKHLKALIRKPLVTRESIIKRSLEKVKPSQVEV